MEAIEQNLEWLGVVNAVFSALIMVYVIFYIEKFDLKNPKKRKILGLVNIFMMIIAICSCIAIIISTFSSEILFEGRKAVYFFLPYMFFFLATCTVITAKLKK